MRFLRKTVQLLFLVNDTPERTELSFSIGVVIGFSPFLGLQPFIDLGG